MSLSGALMSILRPVLGCGPMSTWRTRNVRPLSSTSNQWPSVRADHRARCPAASARAPTHCGPLSQVAPRVLVLAVGVGAIAVLAEPRGPPRLHVAAAERSRSRWQCPRGCARSQTRLAPRRSRWTRCRPERWAPAAARPLPERRRANPSPLLQVLRGCFQIPKRPECRLVPSFTQAQGQVRDAATAGRRRRAQRGK